MLKSEGFKTGARRVVSYLEGQIFFVKNCNFFSLFIFFSRVVAFPFVFSVFRPSLGKVREFLQGGGHWGFRDFSPHRNQFDVGICATD